uniref:Uncharacterized protein n=1 Tax=Nothoprocta perdicaria TaxID=30464 RepID=A0A8C6ZPN6_NOTPE
METRPVQRALPSALREKPGDSSWKKHNLNKAMTIDEAQAFVGDEPCNIKTLTEKDLYCEPPEVQPQPKKRQKRDTINNLPEFSVSPPGEAGDGLEQLCCLAELSSGNN